jgi:hypothetical protein
MQSLDFSIMHGATRLAMPARRVPCRIWPSIASIRTNLTVCNRPFKQQASFILFAQNVIYQHHYAHGVSPQALILPQTARKCRGRKHGGVAAVSQRRRAGCACTVGAPPSQFVHYCAFVSVE